MSSQEIEMVGAQGVEQEVNEIAIDYDVQSKCALVAVCKLLTTLPTAQDESASHLSKKAIKKIRKQIQKDVYETLGKRDADEVINGNLAALEGTAQAIRDNKEIPKGKHHLLLGDLSTTMRTSMLIGYNKFYG